MRMLAVVAGGWAARWGWWDPERAALPLRPLRVSSTGEPGDGKRQRTEFTVDELLESADRLVEEQVPPDDGSRERQDFEDRWNTLRLRLRGKLEEPGLQGEEEELLLDALRTLEAWDVCRPRSRRHGDPHGAARLLGGRPGRRPQAAALVRGGEGESVGPSSTADAAERERGEGWEGGGTADGRRPNV